MSADQTRDLLHGMIDHDPELQRLFMVNAEFRANVTTIANVLPMLVKTLADSAVQHSEAVRQMIERENIMVYCAACVSNVPGLVHADKCERKP